MRWEPWVKSAAILYLKLSMDEIKEFVEDGISAKDWNNLSCSQKLSNDFILDNIEKLDIDNVIHFQSIDNDTRRYRKLE